MKNEDKVIGTLAAYNSDSFGSGFRRGGDMPHLESRERRCQYLYQTWEHLWVRRRKLRRKCVRQRRLVSDASVTPGRQSGTNDYGTIRDKKTHTERNVEADELY